jgi:hypothetical protein
MSTFLKKISLYFLPMALLAIGLEVYVESIPNSYTYKRQYMEQHAAKIQTLVLGSSYAYDGIDAEVLPNAFNLANSSQCFEDDYRLLQRYIVHLDSLQRVILPISYSSLQMVSSSNRRGYYTIYMDLYPRWPISKYSFECCNLELMTKKIIKHTLREDLVRCDSLGQRIGHTFVSRPAVDWQDTQALVANDRFVGPAAQPYIEENTYWLRRIALECQVSGVEFYIVKMPALQDYRDAMPPEQVDAMNQAIEFIASKFDCVRVLDYQDWGTDADFWNATHLNTDGAKRLTREMAAEL